MDKKNNIDSCLYYYYYFFFLRRCLYYSMWKKLYTLFSHLSTLSTKSYRKILLFFTRKENEVPTLPPLLIVINYNHQAISKKNSSSQTTHDPVYWIPLPFYPKSSFPWWLIPSCVCAFWNGYHQIILKKEFKCSTTHGSVYWIPLPLYPKYSSHGGLYYRMCVFWKR